MFALPDRWYIGALIGATIVFCAISYPVLTTWPKLWYDEGLAIEVAHTFAEHQVLDISVAPGVYSPYAVVIAGSNGYPVTLPLAFAFAVFGFSFFVARFYMLAWCVAGVGTLFLFLRKFFDTRSAVLGCLLVLSFASFFANGRTVTGEIPGFTFLLLGAWCLLKGRLIPSGLLLGLAAASKPSLYLWLCIPAAADIFFFQKEKRFGNLIRFGMGYALPIFLWLALTLPRPITSGVFASLLGFYKNPFGSASMLDNVVANVLHAPLESTLLYFFFLLCVSAVGWYFAKGEDPFQKRIVLFFSLLGIISFAYFLRSPGWLRYLMPLELSVLMLLPVFIRNISVHFFSRSIYATLCIAGLVGLQAYVLFFSSHVFRSDTALQTATYLNAHLGSDTVGIINDPAVASLVPPQSRYHYLSMTGVPVHGVNALSLPLNELPKFLVMDEGNRYVVTAYASVLASSYRKVEFMEGSSLFERIR